jgi:hypothetical protein
MNLARVDTSSTDDQQVKYLRAYNCAEPQGRVCDEKGD